MTKAARILTLPVGDDRNPGTRLRSYAYARYLRERGHDVTILPPLAAASGRALRRVARPFDLVRDLASAGRYDAVVAYRKTYPGASARLLRRAAKVLVYEYDDAVYLPSPSEPQDAATAERYRSNFLATASVADLIVAGNDELASAAPHDRTVVVPTGVDLEIFTPRPTPVDASSCVVGWIGTAENLPQWERLLPVFRDLVTRHPHVRFKLVSDREPPSYDVPVDFERFDVAREAACLDFDIGLMPLEDTAWNRGKCSLKALQCMARAIPTVLSPVGMNREIALHDGNGRFASTDDEWFESLGTLATSPDLRTRMGAAARRVVEARYALDAVAGRFVGALEAALAG